MVYYTVNKRWNSKNSIDAPVAPGALKTLSVAGG